MGKVEKPSLHARRAAHKILVVLPVWSSHRTVRSFARVAGSLLVKRIKSRQRRLRPTFASWSNQPLLPTSTHSVLVSLDIGALIGNAHVRSLSIAYDQTCSCDDLVQAGRAKLVERRENLAEWPNRG